MLYCVLGSPAGFRRQLGLGIGQNLCLKKTKYDEVVRIPIFTSEVK